MAAAITGCPCGCLTKPGIYDDPDCVRFRPLALRREQPEHDVVTLGLGSHVRAACEHCRAVAA